MRTTTRHGWYFTFTISDLGRLLGKSPVTLRGWESKGLLSFPKDQSGDRKFTTLDIRQVTEYARGLGRINDHRANLVYALMTLLEQIETENNRKVKI